jgi:RNA polymerase sigma factor (sigma-70 family)
MSGRMIWRIKEQLYRNKSDYELFNQYKNCDRKSFSIILEKHYAYFLAQLKYAIKSKFSCDYDDFIYEKALILIRKEKPQKSSLNKNENTNIKGYLSRTFINYALDQLKESQNKFNSSLIWEGDDDKLNNLDEEKTKLELNQKSNDFFVVVEQVIELNENQKMMFDLYREGFKYNEIAENLNTSISYVQNLMSQIKAKINDNIDEINKKYFDHE